MDYDRQASEIRDRLVRKLSAGGREVVVNLEVEPTYPAGYSRVRLGVVVRMPNGRSEGSEAFSDPAPEAEIPRLTAELYARCEREWERYSDVLT
jgi:hypothetical protein